MEDNLPSKSLVHETCKYSEPWAGSLLAQCQKPIALNEVQTESKSPEPLADNITKSEES